MPPLSLNREIRREVGFSSTPKVTERGIDFGSAYIYFFDFIILAGLVRKISHLHCAWYVAL